MQSAQPPCEVPLVPPGPVDAVPVLPVSALVSPALVVGAVVLVDAVALVDVDTVAPVVPTVDVSCRPSSPQPSTSTAITVDLFMVSMLPPKPGAFGDPGALMPAPIG